MVWEVLVQAWGVLIRVWEVQAQVWALEKALVMREAEGQRSAQERELESWAAARVSLGWA